MPVPVVLAFGGGGKVTLQNQSSDTLTANVTAVNPASGSQSSVQVTVARNRRVDLVGAGLSIESGDEIRVQSPPYRDQVITVR
jgi:hypothetical protein